MILSGWVWHFLISGTLLWSLATSVSCLFHPAFTVMFLGAMSIPILIAAEIYHFVRRRDIRAVLGLRLYTDNFLFFMVLVLAHKYNPLFYIVGAYFMVSAIHFSVLFIFLDCRKDVMWYLRVMVCAGAAFTWTLKLSGLGPWVATVLSLTLVIFSFLTEQVRTIERRRHTESEDSQDIEMRLLRHNINNYVAALDSGLTDIQARGDRISQTLKYAADGLRNFAGHLCRQQSVFELEPVLSYLVNHYRVRWETVVFSLTGCTDLRLNTRLSSLLHSLIVVLTNACESSATRIAVSYGNGTLTVADNGTGFDTSKIRPGHTTKPDGNGLGLVTAIESCSLNRTPLTVQSEKGPA